MAVKYFLYSDEQIKMLNEKVDEIYTIIRDLTHHDGTLFKGVGMYQGKTRNMVYSVVSSEELSRVVSEIKEVDKDAFINIMKSQDVSGKFYQRSNY